MINKKSQQAQVFWKSVKFSCPVLVSHAHMYIYAVLYFPYIDEADMAHTMDRCGTHWALFASHLAMHNPIDGEKFQEKTIRAFPNHSQAYHGVNSQYADPDKYLKETEDTLCVYVGCKFLFGYYKTRFSDPVHAPLF